MKRRTLFGKLTAIAAVVAAGPVVKVVEATPAIPSRFNADREAGYLARQRVEALIRPVAGTLNLSYGQQASLEIAEPRTVPYDPDAHSPIEPHAYVYRREPSWVQSAGGWYRVTSGDRVLQAGRASETPQGGVTFDPPIKMEPGRSYSFEYPEPPAFEIGQADPLRLLVLVKMNGEVEIAPDLTLDEARYALEQMGRAQVDLLGRRTSLHGEG